MSRALLDVNVLLALLDPYHINHEKAQDWFADARFDGWATCPITQNGYLRVSSQSSYSNPVPFAQAVQILGHLTGHGEHEFWPDSCSLLDIGFCDASNVLSHRQITDSYLLALARHNGGRLATFDRRISVSAVPDGVRHLTIIE